MSSATPTDQTAPAVTVLLPVYNAAETIAETINSVLAQTFTDFELLLIDDGSTDNSLAVIERFTDSRIRLVRNAHNLGLIASLNKGIGLARGRYIARMDADDLALPQRLAQQVKALDADPKLAVVASLVNFINTDGEVTGSWNTDAAALTESEIRALLSRTNCLAHPTVMLRKEVVGKYLYNPAQKGAEDYDLWLRMLAAGERIAKLPEVLLHYRIHAASITGQLKAAKPVELRLLHIKRIFLAGQVRRFCFNSFVRAVAVGALRNLAAHWLRNRLPELARDAKRLLTSSPLRVWREGRAFREALQLGISRHVFVFPYTHVGGAERVHADVVRALASEKPLVLFTGFSDNELFLPLFTPHARVLTVAHYVNYPFTRRRAKVRLATAMTQVAEPVFFGCNAGFFYDMLPLLPARPRIVDLIHAFKYQPGANLAHQRYLNLMPRMTARVFVSEAARQEFDRFCFHHNLPRKQREKLVLIPNAVATVSAPVQALRHPAGVLFVGRNSPEKRLQLFLQAAEVLHRAQPEAFRFTVVGAPTDARYSFVQFTGELTDAAALSAQYATHDFLVLTSSREGFPMVILEALMHGLVVVATPVGDVPNRLNASNSIVLDSADEADVVPAVVAALQELITDEARVMTLKQNAKALAVQDFSEAKFQAAYRALLG